MRRIRIFPLLCFIVIGIFNQAVGQQVPFNAPVMLVAGQSIPGFKDGEFDKAQFNGLRSILLAPDNNSLYVADSANAAIRVIHLDQNNEVTTLVGKAGPGSKDGPFASCQIMSPAEMIWGENPQTFYFTDEGSHQVKKVDLQNGTVRTLSGSGRAGLRDGMGKQAEFSTPQGCFLIGDQLLVTDPGNSALRLVDTHSGESRTIFRASSEHLNFKFCFFDAQDGLVCTIQGRPGFWQICKKPGMPLLKADILAHDNKPANADLTLELKQPLEYDISAMCGCGTRILYSLKLAQYKRVMSPLYFAELSALNHIENIDYQLWLPPMEYQCIPNSDANAHFPPQAFRLFDAASGLAINPISYQIFIADATDHRILAVRLTMGSEFYKGELRPPAKPSGVKRIMVLGGSLNYYNADRPALRRDLELQDSLTQRIEYWLNSISLARKKSDRYEVIFAGGPLMDCTSGFAYAFKNFSAIDKYQIDMVLYNYCQMDLYFDALAYLHTPYENGELQYQKADAEYFLTPIQNRILHPLGKEFLRYIINRSADLAEYIRYAPPKVINNNANYFGVFQDKKNQEIFFKLASAEFGRFAEKLRQYQAEKKHNVQLIVNLIPMPVNLSNNEILGEFRQGSKVQPDFLSDQLKNWCEQHGVPFQNTTELARILEPTLFPLYEQGDDYHYTIRMADMIAFFTAMQLIDHEDFSQ